MASETKERAPTGLRDFAENRQIFVAEKIEHLEKKTFYEICKRLFDIIASFTALIVLTIPMVAIAIIIRIDSPGKSIYSQVRLGTDGREFILYKFRSMRIDAEQDGAQWAENADPRVTNIGRFLRKTRLDEIPQLVNILRGEMSIVGPRPERPEFYDVFDTYIVGFRQRLFVKPGLTGYAQVNGGYDLLPEEKIVYDIEYIKNRSCKLDLWCILKTVRVVFLHEGVK